MAIFYISEYERQAIDQFGNPVPVGLEPSLVDQVVAIGVASLVSAPLNAKTHFVRVHTDAICSIVLGPSPVATPTNKRLAANQTEFFGVAPGLSIAVISNT